MADPIFSNLKLASAGEVVKVWDSSTYKICHQVTKNLSLFQSVTWSGDGTQLLCIPVEGDKMLLSSLKSNLSNQREIPIKGCSAAKFSHSSSRFLSVGTKDGSVMIWDLKHSKPKTTFASKNSSGVTCIQFNFKDNLIAAGYTDGSVMIHSNVTGQSSSLLTRDDAEKITDLHFSNAKKSFLGCCSQDGSVVLWDSNTRQLLKRLCEHKAPATGLRFSPANTFLFLSVGLDKNIHFYDTKSRKLVRTIACDTPLCSTDFKDDGVTITVGCSRGKIYFYDLRYTTGFAQHTIHAHTTSVQSLAFQSFISSKEKSSKSGTSTCEASSIYDPIKCMESELQSDFSLVQSNSQTSLDMALQRKESLTADLFSPIRDSFRESFAQGNELSRNVKNSTIFENQSFSFAALSPLQNRNIADNSTKFLMPENIFGFKENDSSPSISNSKATPADEKSPKSSFTTAADNFDAKGESKSLRQQLYKAALSPQSALGMCSRSGDCVPEALWSCNGSDQPAPLKNTPQDEEIVLQQPKLLENSVPNDFAPHKLDLQSLTNHITVDSKSKNSEFLALEMLDCIDEGKGTSKNTTPMTPQAFQVEFFRQLLVDAMEEQTDAIRRNFHRLHVQMAREFEEQRQDLEKMFQKYSHPPTRIRGKKFHDDW